MKYRSDFVTNSSSSSFILAFKNDEQLEEFHQHCLEYNYELFYEFLKNDIKKPTMNEKKKMVQQLRSYYEWNVCEKDKMLSKYVKREDYKSYSDYVIAQNEYEKRPEFQEELNLALQKTDFYKKKKRIYKAEYVIDRIVWDSCGGLIEWSIRHGFIEREMHPFYVYVNTVG